MPMRRKRSFRRNFDSGIFLGSEDTDSSLEEELLKDQDDGRGNKPRFQDSNSSRLNEAADGVLATKSEPSKHDTVKKVINRCLENGLEDVDLS